MFYIALIFHFLYLGFNHEQLSSLMRFIDVHTEFNICINLNILKRDTQRHSIILYQHVGEFSANVNKIGNSNHDEALLKYTKLIEKAKTANADLLVTPEYSCPLNIIEQIIQNPLSQPNNGKIWILGGESINKEELIKIQRYNNDNITVIFDETLLEETKNFYNPLFYVFKASQNDVDKLIILIQFKTCHMGVWGGGELERNNLIQGRDIYIIKNNNSSTRLMSFICSEAMNVRQLLTPQIKIDIDWDDKPYLIVNPQINPDPSYSEFILFRHFILESEKKELISLNWGKETTFGGQNFFKDRGNTARSGVFYKTIENDFSENKILNNHKKGFYYLNIPRNKHVYYINGKVELIEIACPPVSITSGVSAQVRRDGPEAINSYYFDIANNKFSQYNNISDNHITYFTNLGLTNDYFTDPNVRIIDKERLLSLSLGKIVGGLGRQWCEIGNLNSFKLKEATECNSRVTYIDDNYEDSEELRSNYVERINKLSDDILPQTSLYPDSIKDLTKKNIKLKYCDTSKNFNFKYNITDIDDTSVVKTTICYLGVAQDNKINKIFDELQKLFEDGSQGKSRVVVFYSRENNIRSKSDPNAGSITEVPTDNSIII